MNWTGKKDQSLMNKCKNCSSDILLVLGIVFLTILSVDLKCRAIRPTELLGTPIIWDICICLHPWRNKRVTAFRVENGFYFGMVYFVCKGQDRAKPR